MENKTLAEIYVSNQYIDYGDWNYRAEDQIEEAFIAGFAAKDKIILDKLNSLRNGLSPEQKVKLGKTLNEDKIKLLKAQIEVLLQIQNK